MLIASCVDEQSIAFRRQQLNLNILNDPLRLVAENRTENLDPGQIIFETTTRKSKRGRVLKKEEHGKLTVEDIRSAARPYGKMVRKKGVLYHEGAYFRMEVDGTETSHYEIRKEIGFPYKSPILGPAISASLKEKLKYLNKREEIKIIIGLRGFDEWDIDILPPTHLISPQSWLDAQQRRRNQITERVRGFKRARDEVMVVLAQSNGTIVSDESDFGILVAKVNIATISNLKIGAVLKLDTIHELQNNACKTQTNYCQLISNRWRMGQGISKERLYIKPFHDRGYRGAYNNYDRNYSGAIVVGVLESLGGNGWEDEFLGYRDGIYSSSHRIWKRYSCIGSCSSSYDYNDSGTDGAHSIGVMSILSADFTMGQADGVAYDDDCYIAPSYSNNWDDSHCYAWEKAASGMAPRSKLAMYRSTIPSGAIQGVNKAIADNVDVLNISASEHDTGSSECNFTNPDIWESVLENAFDDGIFIVNAPENRSTNSTSCNIDSPGDMPKVFTVNALDSEMSSCRSDYSICPLANYGVVGGIDAPLADGTTIPGAVTGVDLTAPGNITFRGTAGENSGPDIGSITYGYRSGTSYAAPHVSGAAVLVKHWFLNGDHHWINYPGRLHAIMLGMGDRAESTLYHRYWSASDRWGTGRLKLRLFDSIALWGGWGVWTHSLNSNSGNITKYPFGNSPIPVNASFVKCVLNEAEDMSGKTTIGDIYLKMTLADPVSGHCTTYGNTRFDSSYDLKHMISFESDVGGKCVSYTIINGQVAGDSIMANTFCYYSQVKDNEPH